MTRQLSRQSISLLMRRPMVRIHHGSPFHCCIILAPSSNGQDSWFSSMPQGFESPRGHQVQYATNGRLAQLVERYPYKVDVISSSLISTTTFLKIIKCSSIRFLKIYFCDFYLFFINSILKRGSSLVGQNACLSRRRSRVRVPSTAPLFILFM